MSNQAQAREAALEQWMTRGSWLFAASPRKIAKDSWEQGVAWAWAEGERERAIVDAAVAWRDIHRGAPLHDAMAEQQRQTRDALVDAVEAYLKEALASTREGSA